MATTVCLLLVTMPAGLVLGQQMAVDSRCKFEKITDDIFELRFGNWAAEVDVLERDARLVRARIWPGFTNLLVTEIDRGTAGSSVKTRTVNLYVFDVIGTNTTPLLVHKVRESAMFMDEKSGQRLTNVWTDPYKIGTTNGVPVIVWRKTGKKTFLAPCSGQIPISNGHLGQGAVRDSPKKGQKSTARAEAEWLRLRPLLGTNEFAFGTPETIPTRFEEFSGHQFVIKTLGAIVGENWNYLLAVFRKEQPGRLVHFELVIAEDEINFMENRQGDVVFYHSIAQHGTGIRATCFVVGALQNDSRQIPFKDPLGAIFLDYEDGYNWARGSNVEKYFGKAGTHFADEAAIYYKLGHEIAFSIGTEHEVQLKRFGDIWLTSYKDVDSIHPVGKRKKIDETYQLKLDGPEFRPPP